MAFATLALAGPAQAAGGGAKFIPQPVVSKVTCVHACADGGLARAGSRVRLAGKRLGPVDRVVFNGSRSRRDDVAVPARASSGRAVTVTVPGRARSGPLTAQVNDSVGSKPTKPLVIKPPAPPPPPRDSRQLSAVPGAGDGGAPLIETGTSHTRAFYGAQEQVTFAYRVTDDEPVNVQIDLVRAKGRKIVQTWRPGPVQPGAVNTVKWTGTSGRRLAPEGRYAFVLTASNQKGASARSSQNGQSGRDTFDFYGNIFPVRGKHDFGGSGARFGTGRAGHSHQGHDVFAPCGTPMVAARGGVVKFRQYHAAAGNYIVINGDQTGTDYAYMHLTKPSPFKPGQRVFTGQQIGTVGESGNARGCHLHFELWGSPGWYDGGRPFDPLPSLLSWDRVS